MTAFREFEHDLNLVYRTLNTTDVTCTPGLNIEYVFVSNHSYTHHTHTGCSSPLVVWVQAKKDMVKLERAGSDGGEGRGGGALMKSKGMLPVASQGMNIGNGTNLQKRVWGPIWSVVILIKAIALGCVEYV